MAAKRIPRAPKADTRHNGESVTRQPSPDTGHPKLIAIPVANGTTVLCTPERAELVRNRYKYLTDFKK